MNLPTVEQIEKANPNLTSVLLNHDELRMRIGIKRWAEMSVSKSGKRFKCYKRFVNESGTDWVTKTTYLKHWESWVKSI